MPRNRSEKETPEDAKWRTYLLAEHADRSSSATSAAYQKSWKALTAAQRARAHALYQAGTLLDLAKATYDAA